MKPLDIKGFVGFCTTCKDCTIADPVISDSGKKTVAGQVTCASCLKADGVTWDTAPGTVKYTNDGGIKNVDGKLLLGNDCAEFCENATPACPCFTDQDCVNSQCKKCVEGLCK
jgi:hypothetical protein